jgi:predicted NBD/HSP70 family sugar kinase
LKNSQKKLKIKNESEDRKCLALDIGATYSRLSIINENGQILRSDKVATPQKNPVEIIREKIIDFLQNEKIIGIAFSIAGPVNKGVGSFTNLPGQPKISPYDFKKISSNVILLNDAAAAVYAEYAKDPRSNMVYITMSSGIGGGVIQSNRLVHFNNTDKEIGHIEIQSEYHMPCGCKKDRYNHWEAFCSGGVLVNFFEAWKLKEDISSDFNPKEARDIFVAAKKGDRIADKFLKEAFSRVNKQAFEIIIKKYNPEKIVLGGSAATNNKDEILSGINDIMDLPKITFTEYGDDISLIGASEYLFGKDLDKHE